MRSVTLLALTVAAPTSRVAVVAVSPRDGCGADGTCPAGCALRVPGRLTDHELEQIRAAWERHDTPIIVEQLQDNHAARSDWTAEYLMNSGCSVKVADESLIAQRGSTIGELRGLREYIGGNLLGSERSGLFAFDNGGFFEQPEGKQLAGVLDTSGADAIFGDNGKLILSLGGFGSGLPWHTHYDNWLELIKGRKRWWTATHGNASIKTDITLNASDWIQRELHGDLYRHPPEGICAFTQRAGEVVLNPSLYHSTYSLDEFTLGFGRLHNDPYPRTFSQVWRQIILSTSPVPVQHSKPCQF